MVAQQREQSEFPRVIATIVVWHSVLLSACYGLFQHTVVRDYTCHSGVGE
jgi:hypothetical protein